MMNFGDYSKYYDLFYRSKNYSTEVDFILSQIALHHCFPKNILDLGCGTGSHAYEFNKRNIAVTGIDSSSAMIDAAKRKNSLINPCGSLSAFHVGDARTVRLRKTFSTVTSLFHVMSYQKTEEDILAVLRTAWEHLDTGGMFLFDFWCGNGFLSKVAERKQVTVEDSEFRATRISKPIYRPTENILEVHYEIGVTQSSTHQKTAIKEKHELRYWFLPELFYLAKSIGFTICKAGPWMSELQIGIDTSNAWLLLNKA